MALSDIVHTNKLIRYVIVAIAIFLLLKVVMKKTGTRETTLATVVLFALYVIVENLFTKKSLCGPNVENFDTTTTQPNQVVNSPIIPNQVSGNLPAVAPSQTTTMATLIGAAKQAAAVSQQQQQVQAQQQSMQPAMQLTMQPTMPAMATMPPASSAMKPGECVDCVKKTTDEYGMDSYVYKTPAQKYESGPTRSQVGVMDSQTQYTDYNILPVTPEDSRLYEYGYSFLPPEKWFPVPPHPPICVTEKKCPVCPVTTTGTPVDMKEWNDSRRITPGDMVNVDYVRDVLNAGR